MLKLILVISLALVVIFVTIAAGEPCTVNTDCTTNCGFGAWVLCQHPDSSDGIKPGGGLCTCYDLTASCPYGYKEECYGSLAPNLNCRNETRKCYDGLCICDRFPLVGWK